MAGRQAGRKEPLVPVAGEEAPAIARQFVGEVLAPGLRRRWTVAVKPGVTQRISVLGSWPRHQAGKATEARCDFRCRGGRLTISRRIWPARTAASFAAISSTCQFIANWVRGLSARSA